jgi:cob(I)alamin adenosyltransferase
VSISTRGGDEGKTNLPGGQRVSKSDPRIEWYGAVDELVSTIGFARSIIEDAEIAGWLEHIQRDLFKAGGSFSADSASRAEPFAQELLARLDEYVARIEAVEGILKDWALPGALPSAAALDVARTICRRLERLTVQLAESGSFSNLILLASINRLSDVLWLFARLLELRAKSDSALRDKSTAGKPWSRAW